LIENASLGGNTVGQPITPGTAVGGRDPNGNFDYFGTDGHGNLNISANLTLSSSLTAFQGGAPWSVIFPPNALPISINGTVTAYIPGGGSSVNIAAFGGTNVFLGQQNMANSMPVVLAANQLPLAINGSVTAFFSPASNQSVNLAQVNGQTISLGQTTMASSLPVVIASNELPLAINGSVTAFSLQSTIPWQDNLTQVGGQSISLGQTSMANSVPVVLPVNQLPLAINGTVTAFVFQATPIWQNNISQFGGNPVFIGQQVMASSIPVVLPPNQLPLAINGAVTAFVSSFPALQNVNLTEVGGSNIFLGQGLISTSLPVVLPPNQLPLAVNGSVTAFCLQSTIPWATNVSQFGGTTVSLGQQNMANSMPVVLPVNQLPLAINGAVTAYIAAGGPTGNVNLIQVGGAAIALGQTNMAGSVPVVLPSNQLPLAVNGAVTAFISGTPPFNLAQFGGTSVALGQQNMANSIPVVLAINQLPLSISGSVTATLNSSGSSTLAPGSNYIGFVGAMSDTSGISNEGTTLNPAVSSVNIAASTTNQIIVPSTANMRVRILQLVAVAGATTTNLTFGTTTGNAAITPTFQNAANGGEVLPFSPIGWFDTAVGDGLTVTTGAGSTTGILFKYITF
jgi:hypothetical protein